MREKDDEVERLKNAEKDRDNVCGPIERLKAKRLIIYRLMVTRRNLRTFVTIWSTNWKKHKA